MARPNTQKAAENVTLENARIVFRNFAGAEGRFNRKGDRNFGVLLDADTATAMAASGWNIKTLKPREEDDEPQAWLKVKVNFGGRPPRVVLVTSRGRTNLGEDEVSILDFADILNVDLIIRPYHYDIDGSQGVTAYLQSIYVTINEDELERKYSDVPDSHAASKAWTVDE